MRSAFIVIVLQMSTVQTNKQTNKLVKHANFDIALKKLFKGSQLHFAHIIVYCYHEFKLRYLKNQKLFSIRVK